MTNYYDETVTNSEENKQAVDREEWIRQKQAEREKVFGMIKDEADQVAKDGRRFESCLDLMSRFGKYSVSNILLLEAQRPHARRLADFQTWKDQGISINKGETGIMLLEPGKEYTRKDGSTGVSYNVKKVFDVAQTKLTFAVEPIAKTDCRLLIRALVHSAPCGFENADGGGVSGGRSACYMPAQNKIYALSEKNLVKLFLDLSAAVAEAHLSKGEYGAENKLGKAQCVAYILGKRNNIEVSTFDIGGEPAMLRNMNGQQVRDFLGDVREVANTITKDMDRFFEKLKGVPEKEEAR